MTNATWGASLAVLDRAFRQLEALVPPPELVRSKSGPRFRHTQKLLEQALIQKLARYISGLRAATLLLSQGYVQEQAVLQRTLDEIFEDIWFLAIAHTNDMVTPLHTRYLTAFYEEEFNHDTRAPLSEKNRDAVPRKKIRAYLSRVFGDDHNSPRAKASSTIGKIYSGYVHAASPQIMDMVGGSPPRFHLDGMLGTPRIHEHEKDLWNYYYRGLMLVVVIGKAAGDQGLVDQVERFMANFEERSGANFGFRESRARSNQ